MTADFGPREQMALGPGILMVFSRYVNMNLRSPFFSRLCVSAAHARSGLLPFPSAVRGTFGRGRKSVRLVPGPKPCVPIWLFRITIGRLVNFETVAVVQIR